ncbi:unnamed protein product [Bubo scandiacus]
MATRCRLEAPPPSAAQSSTRTGGSLSFCWAVLTSINGLLRPPAREAAPGAGRAGAGGEGAGAPRRCPRAATGLCPRPAPGRVPRGPPGARLSPCPTACCGHRGSSCRGALRVTAPGQAPGKCPGRVCPCFSGAGEMGGLRLLLQGLPACDGARGSLGCPRPGSGHGSAVAVAMGWPGTVAAAMGQPSTLPGQQSVSRRKHLADHKGKSAERNFMPFPGSAPGANRTPCRILSSADTVSSWLSLDALFQKPQALQTPQSARAALSLARPSGITAENKFLGSLLPCVSVVPPLPRRCFQRLISSQRSIGCPEADSCPSTVCPRREAGWMLKSRGSINCRPSRGRGRHNWSRNAVGSSSSSRTWGPAASCRRKLRSRKGLSHVVVPLAVREWPKCGTSREVPAPLSQPEGPCGGPPGAEEATPEPSSLSQQLQPEVETWQPQGQRQVPVPEPQRGEPAARRDTQQQKLEPAQALASVQALQLDLDFCRCMNRERLVQLQQQERAVEQKHQDFIFLMQQYQAVIGKRCSSPQDQKDEVVQTEVTSSVAAHSRSDSSYDIPREARTELLMQLGAQEEQSQGLRHSMAQLQQELGATQAREQRRLQQLSGATETIQDLQQEAASTRKRLAELLQEVQDMATLQAELAQAQQEKAKQEEKAAAYKEERRQLLWELRELQECQEQSKQEAQALQERLRELSSRAQHWQQLHHASERALATREKELVVCKLELSFLKEELSKATEQVWDGVGQHHSPGAGAQAGPPAAGRAAPSPGRTEAGKSSHMLAHTGHGRLSFQIETLRSSQALAHRESSRTHEDRELVLVNISQCLAEQIQLHERQGHKTQQQSEQTGELMESGAELSAHGGCCCCLQGCRGQTDNRQTARAPASPHPRSLPSRHLQDAVGRVQEENTCLVVRTRENKCERLKMVPALHHSAGLPPPNTRLQDKKQCKTKQGLN